MSSWIDSGAQRSIHVRTEFAKENLEKARYIHLAAHGIFNGEKPLYSSIVLARSGNEDGFLRAHDLLGMKLQSCLVVLSACQTAAPHPDLKDDRDLMIHEGEGVVGLSWALFAANSPSQLLTLWKITDESSFDLMKDFYTELAPAAPTWQGKISKASALQQAQLKMLRSKDRRHPSFWAPYVLHGDFRP